MNDTSPKIAAQMARMIAAKTPEERLRMASSMFDAGRRLAEAGLRAENKSLTEAQLRGRLFMRFYGSDFSDTEIKKIMARMPNMQL